MSRSLAVLQGSESHRRHRLLGSTALMLLSILVSTSLAQAQQTPSPDADSPPVAQPDAPTSSAPPLPDALNQATATTELSRTRLFLIEM